MLISNLTCHYQDKKSNCFVHSLTLLISLRRRIKVRNQAKILVRNPRQTFASFSSVILFLGISYLGNGAHQIKCPHCLVTDKSVVLLMTREASWFIHWNALFSPNCTFGELCLPSNCFKRNSHFLHILHFDDPRLLFFLCWCKVSKSWNGM